MSNNIAFLLVRSLMRSTVAFHYALIAYINLFEITMDVIYSYIDDKPFIHGARGLSIARIISIESLKQHFTTDIVLANSCFDVDMLGRNDVIRLKRSCAEAFKSSSILSSIVKLALFLNNTSGETSVAKNCCEVVESRGVRGIPLTPTS